ncbi:recombinase family protein [Nocardia sp. NPDC059764]|uniref:recombinase family protein n=1 Tax=Nocardia sp. NPDC059764 TaxID=3346939 RepID=UPI00365F31F5
MFADKKSGKNAEREELQRCLEYLRPGDTLVVPALDRLSRSMQDLLAIDADRDAAGPLRRSRGPRTQTAHQPPAAPDRRRSRMPAAYTGRTVCLWNDRMRVRVLGASSPPRNAASSTRRPGRRQMRQPPIRSAQRPRRGFGVLGVVERPDE